MPNIEEPRRSKRQRVPKSFGPDFLAFLLENEPLNFKEAMCWVIPHRLWKGLMMSL